MTKRILFVDDEQMVLRGIERSLRNMRQEWHAEFSLGGLEALEAMARQTFDVVITDMRMPRMDGAQLLEQVREKFPHTVRMALSGQSDKATILRAVGPTHQYLSKPCDVEELKQKLVHALSLRDLLDNSALKEVVSRLETVPCSPRLHHRLTDLLQSSSASIAEASNIIARDIGMTARVLQLVNSAFLGTPVAASSAEKATTVLGLENLRTLTLSLRMFVPFEGSDTIRAEAAGVWKHSLASAQLARAIAQSEGCPASLVEAAYTAGLLHDIGKLILADSFSEEYEFCLRSRSEQQISTMESEYETFRSSHAQVGAYLLGLWGLPMPIVEAVAWHHQPSQAEPVSFSPLIAVHVGTVLNHRKYPALPQADNTVLDEVLLTSLGLKQRLPVWSELAEKAELETENWA